MTLGSKAAVGGLICFGTFTSLAAKIGEQASACTHAIASSCCLACASLIVLLAHAALPRPPAVYELEGTGRSGALKHFEKVRSKGQRRPRSAAALLPCFVQLTLGPPLRRI